MAATLQEQARALGDPTRHQIFRYIASAGRPVDVAELTAHLGLNHNAIRQHLAKLVPLTRVSSPKTTPRAPVGGGRASTSVHPRRRAAGASPGRTNGSACSLPRCSEPATRRSTSADGPSVRGTSAPRTPTIRSTRSRTSWHVRASTHWFVRVAIEPKWCCARARSRLRHSPARHRVLVAPRDRDGRRGAQRGPHCRRRVGAARSSAAPIGELRAAPRTGTGVRWTRKLSVALCNS